MFAKLLIIFGVILVFGLLIYPQNINAAIIDDIYTPRIDASRIDPGTERITTFTKIEYKEVGLDKFTPFIKIQGEFDDNIFLEATDEKEDFITTISPGLILQMPFKGNSLKVSYKADIVEYNDYSELNAVNHDINALLELNFKDITLTFEDRFLNVTDRPDTEITARIHLYENRARAHAKLELNRLILEGGYFNRNYDYKTDIYEIEDRNEDMFSLISSYRFFSKTSLLLEFDYGRIRYDDVFNSDADYYQWLTGVRGKLTAKTIAEVKLGYQARDYEEAGESDYEGFVTNTRIDVTFSPSDELVFDFLRSPHESSYATVNYFIINYFGLGYRHDFNEKCSGNIYGSYQVNEYPVETTEGTETKEREDEFWSLGVGVNYHFKEWLTGGLKYEFVERDSNFDIFDYKNNRPSVTITAAF